jgi:hypothetical protein
MSAVKHKITLDIHKRETQVFISAFRGDTLRTIIASLTESGKPYIIPDGCTTVFTAVKPDGNYLYNDCIIDTVTNSIVYDFTSQTTAVVGEVKCQFKLIGVDGGVLAAPNFSILVGDTLYNEEPIVESSEEFTALTNYLASLPDYIRDVVEECIGTSEDADAISARISAASAKSSAESAKTSENNAKASENVIKQSETNAKQSEESAKQSESNAKVSESNAKASADSAKASESSAISSSASAEASAESAEASRVSAEGSANNAKASENNAKASETKALSYANTAESFSSQSSSYASLAQVNANNAKTSEVNAKASETNAMQSASSAMSSALTANQAYTAAKQYADSMQQEVMSPVNFFIEDDEYFVNFNLNFTTYNGLLYVHMCIEDVTIGAYWNMSRTSLSNGWAGISAFENMINKAKSVFTNTPSLWSGEAYIKGSLHAYIEVNLSDSTVSVTVAEHSGIDVYVDDSIYFDLVLTPKVI